MVDPKSDFDKLTEQPGKPEHPPRVPVKALEDLIAALRLVLDQVDYRATPAACGPAEPIAGVLSVQVIDQAHAAIANAKRAILEAEGQGGLAL